MHITAPVQYPCAAAQCDEIVKIIMGGAGQSRNIVISEKQLRLLARGIRILQAKEDGMQLTPVESAMLVDMGVMFDDIAEDNSRSVHGVCL